MICRLAGNLLHEAQATNKKTNLYELFEEIYDHTLCHSTIRAMHAQVMISSLHVGCLLLWFVRHQKGS